MMAQSLGQSDSMEHQQRAPVALIMAAGKGTRMNSSLPKVVHEVAGRPMICHVVEACLAVGCARVVAIVGYEQDLVRRALSCYGDRVSFAVQAEQLGTGHAVQCAKGSLPWLSDETPVLVLAGDGPLIRTTTLEALLRRHLETGAAATLATSVIEDPTGYGRIVRDADGRFTAIVEQKNATPEQLAIREVNPSYYCFRLGSLFVALEKVERDGASGEYYLTDVLAILVGGGGDAVGGVEVIDAVPAEDVLSINTPDQLAQVDRVLRDRLAAAGGVSQ